MNSRFGLAALGAAALAVVLTSAPCAALAQKSGGTLRI